MLESRFFKGQQDMGLNASQRRHLRGLTHHINPVVMVGDKGLTENVLAEIERALRDHELIKVKLRADRQVRKAMIQAIVERSGAQTVHAIGQTACFYRRNPEHPVITLPRGNRCSHD